MKFSERYGGEKLDARLVAEAFNPPDRRRPTLIVVLPRVGRLFYGWFPDNCYGCYGRMHFFVRRDRSGLRRGSPRNQWAICSDECLEKATRRKWSIGAASRDWLVTRENPYHKCD